MTIASQRKKREYAFQLQMQALASQGSAKAIKDQVREFERDR